MRHQLIEAKYTEGISSGEFGNANGISPAVRLGQLRRLIQTKPIVRVLEAHNGLTGLIVENSKISEDGETCEFDAMWESSLTDSTAKGKPDIELVDFSSRVKTINEILEVTTKPIIVDGDTGGQIEHFKYHVRTLERLGVSAVIIEDKIGLKRNSLFGTDVAQEQDSIENFCEKISQGKKSLVSDQFMIIARIESLILKQGLDDAVERAKAYLGAGADGIMIHSREKSGQEIFDFCEVYQGLSNKKPLVVVPSAYSHVTEEQLQERGVQIVIYANHLLRSAYPAMIKTAESILKNKRAQEASDDHCISIKEVLNIIPQNAA